MSALCTLASCLVFFIASLLLLMPGFISATAVLFKLYGIDGPGFLSMLRDAFAHASSKAEAKVLLLPLTIILLSALFRPGEGHTVQTVQTCVMWSVCTHESIFCQLPQLCCVPPCRDNDLTDSRRCAVQVAGNGQAVVSTAKLEAGKAFFCFALVFLVPTFEVIDTASSSNISSPGVAEADVLCMCVCSPGLRLTDSQWLLFRYSIFKRLLSGSYFQEFKFCLFAANKLNVLFNMLGGEIIAYREQVCKALQSPAPKKVNSEGIACRWCSPHWEGHACHKWTC